VNTTKEGHNIKINPVCFIKISNPPNVILPGIQILNHPLCFIKIKSSKFILPGNKSLSTTSVIGFVSYADFF
jgi:hypothetical protein